GLNYGITSAGDNPTTGNGAVTGSGGSASPIVQNSVVFTLTGFTGTLADITKVSFQYGTALSDANVPASGVPEPSSLAIAGLGGLGLLGYRLRRQRTK